MRKLIEVLCVVSTVMACAILVIADVHNFVPLLVGLNAGIVFTTLVQDYVKS